MARDRALKRRLGDLKRGIKRAVDEARASGGTPGAAHNVNVARRANVVVASNVGAPGSTHAITAEQRVQIRQTGGATHVEHESTNTTSVQGKGGA